ncbi:MAG: hypothetical protein ACTSUR_07060 [Candidatus Heimdallarchaeaceae archaeon]
MKVYLSDSLRIKGESWEITCDSTNSKYHPLIFYSHAHSDHIPRKIPKTNILCSSITKLLVENLISNSEESSYFEKFNLNHVEFKQISSGHIIGSTALIIETENEKVVYTGDVSIRQKGFLEPFKPEKCDTLVIESTFGSPEFEFPEHRKTIKETKELIDDYLSKGTPIVLMGYALGKAQLLYHEFSNLSETKILHGANFRINQIFHKNEIEGAISCLSYQEAKEKGILEKENNWMMFSPLKSGRDPLYSHLKKKYGVKLFAFSGWCLLPEYKYRMAVDHAITISDHADFKELVEIVEKSSPEHIYTIYGYNIRLAAELRKLGYNAHPLSKQTILDTFF